MRKADHGADEDAAAGQRVAATHDVDRAAAHRGDVVQGGDRAAGKDVVDGQLGLEQRMVDRLGDTLLRDRLGGEGLGDVIGSASVPGTE